MNDQNNYTVNSNRRIVNPKFISIGNISNSNVTISQFSNTDAVKVTFTTSADEAQDFTFDLVYTNPDFSVETITVSAKVVVTTFDYTGVWLLRWYNTSDRALFQDDRITFDASGSSTFAEYNIYPNNNGWTTYQGETFSMSYSDGSLTIHDNYWGNTYTQLMIIFLLALIQSQDGIKSYIVNNSPNSMRNMEPTLRKIKLENNIPTSTFYRICVLYF